ncbi:hypothetical protein [Paenibacillus koleovorans]|uniref:hypothetical protein n=1 Tax=Paenibacillus koleovorans TaxID=121608 RepID=UPI000FD76214|nr:hypothetical protein [Paenibacillus koleovorans]
MNASVLLQPESVAQPCRNFCILGKTSLIDPLDGREKFVLSNFAAHATGNIVLIDVETGVGESILLPGDSGAWALYNWDNEKLIVGTCPGKGYVHSLDLRSRTWAEPLRDDNETYVWNFTCGEDGMLYGSTYPGCVLLRYDPVAHVLTNMGKMSDNPKNMYSRTVGAVPGHIIVTGGMDEVFVTAWNMETQERRLVHKTNDLAMIVETNEQYFSIKSGKEMLYFDSKTFEPLAADSVEVRRGAVEVKLGPSQRGEAIPLASGIYVGVRGQDYFVASGAGDSPGLQRIPVEAPATHIFGLTIAPDGCVWGSSGFGQTIFKYDPRDGSYWNSSVVCNGGGEVYGMQFVGERLFLTAYSGGDHIVYDPSKPWDQLGNVNPRTLQSVGPDWIRPLGHSIVGPDRAIWTGWSAKYGVYGGGITRLDTDTLELTRWANPLATQHVSSLAADDRYVYFVSTLGGNGLAAQDEVCHFGVLTTGGDVVYSEALPNGAKAGKLAACGGRVWLAVDEALRVFDPDALRFVDGGDVALGRRATGFCAVSERELLVFVPDELLVLDTASGRCEARAALPGIVDKASVTPDRKQLYFGIGTTLYTLPLQALLG